MLCRTAALPLAVLLAATPAAAGFREVEGTATYGETTALTADAVLEVQLLEMAPGGATPTPIASISIRVRGARPFPFRLTYDDAMVDPEHNYALAARIRQDGETVFRTAEASPMFAAGAAPGGPPVIRMVRAEPSEGWPQPDLQRSEWVVVELGSEGRLGAAQARLTFGEDAVRGSGGCNDFSASYRVDPPDGLSFGKIESTLRGCSGDVTQQERLVFRALAHTTRYRIDEDRTLVLLNAEDTMLLRLARVDN